MITYCIFIDLLMINCLQFPELLSLSSLEFRGRGYLRQEKNSEEAKTEYRERASRVAGDGEARAKRAEVRGYLTCRDRHSGEKEGGGGVGWAREGIR